MNTSLSKNDYLCHGYSYLSFGNDGNGPVMITRPFFRFRSRFRNFTGQIWPRTVRMDNDTGQPVYGRQIEETKKITKNVKNYKKTFGN